MTVIDLAAVREKLAADRRLAEEVATRLATFIVSESVRQAERAFAVAGPIAGADEELSRIIHRGVLRRLRSDVRRKFKGLDLKAWAIEAAAQIYTGRVFALIDERNASSRVGAS